MRNQISAFGIKDGLTWQFITSPVALYTGCRLNSPMAEVQARFRPGPNDRVNFDRSLDADKCAIHVVESLMRSLFFFFFYLFFSIAFRRKKSSGFYYWIDEIAIVGALKFSFFFFFIKKSRARKLELSTKYTRVFLFFLQIILIDNVR